MQVGGGRVSLVNSSTLCDGAWHSALIEHHMVKDMMSDDDSEYGNNPDEIVNNNYWSVPLLQLYPNSRKSVFKNILLSGGARVDGGRGTHLPPWNSSWHSSWLGQTLV